MSTVERLLRELPPYFRSTAPHLMALLGAWATGVDLIAADMATTPGVGALLTQPSLWTDWVAGLFGVIRLVNETDEHLLLRLIQVLTPRLAPAAIEAYLTPIAAGPVTVFEGSGGRSVGRLFTDYERRPRAETLSYTREGLVTNPDTGQTVAADTPVWVTSPLGVASALDLYRGTTNVLTTGLATSATLSGWAAAGGAQLALATTPVWQGTTSVEVTAPVSGAVSAVTAISAGAVPWTYSTWLTAPSGATVAVTLQDTTGAVVGANTVTLAGTWNDVAVTGVPAATASGLTATITAVTSGTWYMGAQQLEALPYRTPWQDPANGARNPGTLAFDYTTFPSERGTATVVVTPGPWATTATALVSGYTWPLLTSVGSGALSWYASPDSLTASISGGVTVSAPWPTDWAAGGLCTLTWDMGTLTLWFNGVQLAAAAGTVLPNPSSVTLGGGPSGAWDGRLGPMRFLQQAQVDYEIQADVNWYSEVLVAYYNDNAGVHLFPPNGNTWRVFALNSALTGWRGGNLTGAAWYGRVRFPLFAGQGLVNPFTVGTSSVGTTYALTGPTLLTNTVQTDYNGIFRAIRPAGVKLVLDVM